MASLEWRMWRGECGVGYCSGEHVESVASVVSVMSVMSVVIVMSVVSVMSVAGEYVKNIFYLYFCVQE